MKNSYLVNVAVGSVLLLPALTLQKHDAGSLAEQLDATVRAIEELAGIEQRLQAKDPAAVVELLRATEPPIADPLERDALRDELRDELQSLQTEFDALPPGAAQTASGDAAAAAARSSVAPTSQQAGDAVGGARVAFEPHGYIADHVKLARVLHREQRYAEALLVLGQARKDPAAAYWRGRCLERLERVDEAIAAYREAAAATPPTGESDLAREAADFLAWRTGFSKGARGAAEARKP